jgi:hypothetical protein
MRYTSDESAISKARFDVASVELLVIATLLAPVVVVTPRGRTKVLPFDTAKFLETQQGK